MAFDKVIVLDDEMIIRKTLAEGLRKKRLSVAMAETLEEARVLMAKDSFDVIFADVCLPDGEGTELLEDIGNQGSGPIVVMMTGNGSVSSAVECMRAGAFDYIMKPFDMEQIEVVLEKAEAYSQLLRVNQLYTIGEYEQEEKRSLLIGECTGIGGLRDLVKKVAATEATVLIQGENGTGKELIARELYRESTRSSAPYIRVNCAAISETLMESEFFGHEKGAFTGATGKREGRFELAHGGTILLDEISEISPKLQAKLLRVLQEMEFERVGGNKTVKVDVRVIATTNRDLRKCVEAGDFREDLYYRLNVFPIHVPPLRDRGEDVLVLAENFLKGLARKHGKKGLKFSKRATKAMLEHSWPGNVRELQNTVERAVILADAGKFIEPRHLGLMSEGGGVDEQSLASLHDMERQHILTALEKAEGQRKKAAEMLDISMRTLNSKLKQYDEAGELAS